jgi:hypothetical protein
VRRALAVLRERGLARVDRPRGTFVVDRKPKSFDQIPADCPFSVRMPTRDEVARLGLLPDGEPVIEIYHPRGPIEVVGTLHKVFGPGPAST